MKEIEERYSQDERKDHLLSVLSLFEHGEQDMVRMANLCNLTCHKVNGVSAIHTQLLKDRVFKEFNEYFPNKIINITNGVTPRRWIQIANQKLSELYDKYLNGNEWLTDTRLLNTIHHLVDDSTFQQE